MILEANKIYHSYTQGKNKLEILKGVDFFISGGETLSIMGKSGSGKSTLLNLLAGLMKPDEGEVRVDQEDFSALSDSQRTKVRGEKLGVVFQQFHLLPHLSALENVNFAARVNNISNSMQKSERLLQRVGLKDRAYHLPHELSGGEMQRVAVARALVTNPKVILADEPSGSLDEKNSQEVVDLIFDLVRENNTSLIFVTHDEDLAKRCDRCLTLDGGVLHEAASTN